MCCYNEYTTHISECYNEYTTHISEIKHKNNYRNYLYNT